MHSTNAPVAGHFTAWVSWNGATEVIAWRINGGPSARALSSLAAIAIAAVGIALRAHSGNSYPVENDSCGIQCFDDTIPE